MFNLYTVEVKIVPVFQLWTPFYIFVLFITVTWFLIVSMGTPLLIRCGPSSKDGQHLINNGVTLDPLSVDCSLSSGHQQ